MQPPWYEMLPNIAPITDCCAAGAHAWWPGGGLVTGYRDGHLRRLDPESGEVRELEARHTAPVRGVQNVLVLRKNGSILASGKTEQNITTVGGCKVRAGLFDDPFFFDLNGFKNNFMFTGSDFFAGMNVTAIVLEIPRTELGGTSVGVWARTSVGGVQFDRMGRPAINTALIPSAQKNAFNAGIPKNDPANFGATVRASIASLNGGDTATAATLASILLPDVLTVDVTSTAGFLNGRQLANDVIDAELSLITGGALSTDSIPVNDKLFRSRFPYAAAPH